MSQHKKKSGFMKGAALGALGGAIAGLFLSPKSGAENREDIKRKAREVESKVKDKVDTTKQKTEGKAKEVKETGERLRDKTKQAYDAGKKAFNEEPTDTEEN